MGMFDKDKEMGLQLDEHFDRKQEFIILGARVATETVDTRLGPAEKAVLHVQNADGGAAFDVSTLGSAIVAKVKEAEPGDFPAVVCWDRVDTKTFKDVLILRFLRPVGQTPRDPEPSGFENRVETPGA